MPFCMRGRFREAAPGCRILEAGHAMTNKPNQAEETLGEYPPGIVVLDRAEPPRRPLIPAFIWGAPQQQAPTLPFGRWKVSAA